MKKVIYFMTSWVIGLAALNYFIFESLFRFIRDENAVAILCVLIVSVFTVVAGVVAGKKS